MRLFVFLILSFLPASVLAQWELAKINDPDGFVNVRNDKGTNSDIINRLNAGELFLCRPSDENWWQVRKYNDQYGYAYKTKITIIANLSDQEINQSIFIGFDCLSQKVKEFLKTIKTFNQIYLDKRKEAEDYEQNIFNPLLRFISTQFCKYKDIEILDRFLQTLVIDQGSANESLCDALAECYICSPDLVLQHIDRYTLDNRKDLVTRLIFGFDNLTYQVSASL